MLDKPERTEETPRETGHDSAATSTIDRFLQDTWGKASDERKSSDEKRSSEDKKISDDKKNSDDKTGSSERGNGDKNRAWVPWLDKQSGTAGSERNSAAAMKSGAANGLPSFELYDGAGGVANKHSNAGAWPWSESSSSNPSAPRPGNDDSKTTGNGEAQKQGKKPSEKDSSKDAGTRTLSAEEQKHLNYAKQHEQVDSISQGATLFDISKQHLQGKGEKTDSQAVMNEVHRIANLNGIKNPDLIRAGARLQLEDGKSIKDLEERLTKGGKSPDVHRAPEPDKHTEPHKDPHKDPQKDQQKDPKIDQTKEHKKNDKPDNSSQHIGRHTKQAEESAVAVAKVAKELGVDPALAIATMLVESGGNPKAVGDGGTSFGLFQLHHGGGGEYDRNYLGRQLTRNEAFDPETNAQVSLHVFKQTQEHGKYSSPGHLAAAAQNPADHAGYARLVDGRMAEARQILKSIEQKQADETKTQPENKETPKPDLPPVSKPDQPPAVNPAKDDPYSFNQNGAGTDRTKNKLPDLRLEDKGNKPAADNGKGQYKLDDPRTWTEAQKSLVAAAKAMANNSENIHEKAWHYNKDSEGGNDGGGRRGGRTACDESVDAILKLAGAGGTDTSPGASALGKVLEKQGWNQVPKQATDKGDFRPGDVIVWKGQGGGMGHIGMVVPSSLKGEAAAPGKYAGLECVNNSSRDLHAVSKPLDEQLRDKRDYIVLRPPEKTNETRSEGKAYPHGEHRDSYGYKHDGHPASPDHESEAKRMEEHYAQYRRQIEERVGQLNQEGGQKPAVNPEPQPDVVKPEPQPDTTAAAKTKDNSEPVKPAGNDKKVPDPAESQKEHKQSLSGAEQMSNVWPKLTDAGRRMVDRHLLEKPIQSIDEKYPFKMDSLKPQCEYDKIFLQAKEDFKQRQASGQAPSEKELFERAKAIAPPGQRFFEASVPYWVSSDGSQAVGQNFMWDENGKSVSENYWRRGGGDQLGHGKDATIYHNIEAVNASGTDVGWINQSTNESYIAKGGNPPVDMHGRSMGSGTSAGCEAHPSEKNYQNWLNFRDKMHYSILDNQSRGLRPFASLHIGYEYALRSSMSDKRFQ